MWIVGYAHDVYLIIPDSSCIFSKNQTHSAVDLLTPSEVGTASKMFLYPRPSGIFKSAHNTRQARTPLAKLHQTGKRWGSIVFHWRFSDISSSVRFRCDARLSSCYTLGDWRCSGGSFPSAWRPYPFGNHRCIPNKWSFKMVSAAPDLGHKVKLTSCIISKSCIICLWNL